MATSKISFHAPWINDKSDLIYTDSFIKIINFYLFQCPNEYVSSSGKSLRSYGWKNPWEKGFLRLYLYSISDLKNENFLYKAKKYDDVSNGISRTKLTGKFWRTSENKIVFYTDQKHADILTIIFYIRCALAHGRFLINVVNNEVIYIFEAINAKKTQLKARMVLKEKTLIEWIEVLSGGEKEFKNIYHNYTKNIRDFILSEIKNSPSITKQEICENSPYSNELTIKIINQMLNDKILYNRKNKLFLKVIENEK